MNIDSDKEIHTYFSDHWRPLFPNIGHRTAYVRQSTNLSAVKQKMHALLVAELEKHSSFHIVDGFLIPLCNTQKARWKIEAVISQLTQRFSIQKDTSTRYVAFALSHRKKNTISYYLLIFEQNTQ